MGLASLHDIGEEANVPRTLDRLSEFALLGRTDGGNAAWNDLAALRDETLKQADIFIIDLGRVFGCKRTAFAPTKKWAGHILIILEKSHGRHGHGAGVRHVPSAHDHAFRCGASLLKDRLHDRRRVMSCNG